jgi:predicted tellurium resistance membrane protein TerC
MLSSLREDARMRRRARFLGFTLAGIFLAALPLFIVGGLHGPVMLCLTLGCLLPGVALYLWGRRDELDRKMDPRLRWAPKVDDAAEAGHVETVDGRDATPTVGTMDYN